MVLVGPSGCGKTTALRMVAGLEEVTDGTLRIGDDVVNTVEPHLRDVAMVFQNYALYPHLSVFDNIAFPLQSQRLPKPEIKERVERTAAALGLSELLSQRPKTLSGGQRQRVAMGRAIVRRPRVFLMDEPLSNLDAKLRVEMRAEISRLQQDVGVTTIYVTHDQVEAMTMGTRIAVMRKGELQQLGPPQELYDSPINLFVATFIGSPSMNLLTAGLELEGSSLALRVEDPSLPLPQPVSSSRPDLVAMAGRDVVVGVRPEHLRLADHDPADPRLPGVVTLVEALGPERLVQVEVRGRPAVTQEVIEVARDTDAAVAWTLQHEASAATVRLVVRTAPTATFAPGDRVELSFRAESMLYFDPDTGAIIGR